MDCSLVPLNSAVPRKAGPVEEILPTEPTPNLEKKDTKSISLAGRKQEYLFWQVNLYLEKNKYKNDLQLVLVIVMLCISSAVPT